MASPMSCDSSDGSTENSGIQAACSYHQCASSGESSEYDLDVSFVAPYRSEVRNDCLCPYLIWDCEAGSQACMWSKTANDIYECCASKFAGVGDEGSNSSNNLLKASCECSIKHDCEEGDLQKCVEYSESCCMEDDEECKCKYKSLVCNLAFDQEIFGLEMNTVSDTGDLKSPIEYCNDAAETCCAVKDVGGCRCDFYEPICFKYGDNGLCKDASLSCCGSDNSHCNCDLYTHLVDTSISWEKFLDVEEFHCAQASRLKPDHLNEMVSLEGIYYDLAGQYWIDSSGWMTEDDHCRWHGIKCNEEGHVIEVNLRSNNVTGVLPVDHLTYFYKLEKLDLGSNNLSGQMAVWNWDKSEKFLDSSWFFRLRELTHVDLSQNNLSGEVDVLLAPSVEYANFSHNNFTSVNTFKSYKQSHRTLLIYDLTNNSINQDISSLLENMPRNLEQMVLSNNLVWGPLPSSLEILPSLRRFSVGSNMLSGEIPDFSASSINLQILDLSQQKQQKNGGFSGTIPVALASLQFLEYLNIAGNRLESTIPKVLANLQLLKTLDLSENKLSKTIPKDLGKLGGKSWV